ncbi:MAG: TRAP transporter fused permease subunit [Chloroflexi bacterium]|nr:TRAP transporter fused permease subunit [Chloroflexota bacterium]
MSMDLESMQAKDLEAKKQELIEAEEGPFRALPGAVGVLQRVLLCTIPVLGIIFIAGFHTYLGLMVYTEQYIGVFMTLIFVGAFISTPATKRAPRNRVPWYDVILALAGLPVGLYLMLYYPQIAMRLGELSLERTILGGLTILLILEALRRFVGWFLVIVVAMIVIYGRFADLFPGTLHGLPTSWDRLFAYLYLDPNSMLNLVALASGIALAFIFFGQVLTGFGGGAQLTELAVLAFGRFRGGPAKAAVVGSSLVGTISGGAVTNVMITGSVTIPLMIRTGYRPAMAGAVESVASSGGQIMPPVMGIAAFLIAENLGVPYADVALAAFIPAVLFYLACFVQVDLQAGKEGMKSIPKSMIPKSGPVLRNAWTIFPCLAILVYTLMVIRLDPSTAGVVSGFASVPFLVMAKAGRGHYLRRILSVLEGTGKMMMNIGIIMAGAGVIVGVAGVSGFGFNLAYTLTTLGKGNTLLLLVLAAIVSVILGMGMPSVPAYALVATLVAPALVQMGILPMAAHLFIFYFAIVSNWTPPVALACFAASVISGANPNKIGYIAMRLGILPCIVPFLFVYSPALILRGSWEAILASAITAMLGTLLLGIALVGYLFQMVPWARRVLFFVAGAALLIPFGQDVILGIIVNGIGFVVAVPLLYVELQRRRALPAPAAVG